MDAASQTGLLDTEGFDLAGRALLFFACAKKSKQKKAPPTDASLRDSLRCSRARGRSFDATSLSRRNSAGSCPPTPARAPLLGASQGNPVRQTAKQKQIAAATCSPLSRVRERVARQRRGRERSWVVCNLQGVFPHSPPSAGLSPARGREEQARQRAFERSAAKRSEPIAVDVQPLAAPAGVARAVGQSAMDGRLSFAATSVLHRVEATPSTSLQPGTRSSLATNGRGLGGVLSLLTFFARAKKVTPGREGQTLSGQRNAQPEPTP